MRYCMYMRVSKRQQTFGSQVDILDKYIHDNNIEDYFFIKEKATTTKSRPLKNELMEIMRRGELDIIVVTRLDRFARSLVELVLSVEEILKRGKTFISVQEGICWTKENYGPAEALQLGMFSAIAQFYRDSQGEKIREGLARRKRIDGIKKTRCKNEG